MCCPAVACNIWWYPRYLILCPFYRPRSEGDNVLGSVRPSVRLSVRPSVRPLTAEPAKSKEESLSVHRICLCVELSRGCGRSAFNVGWADGNYIFSHSKCNSHYRSSQIFESVELILYPQSLTREGKLFATLDCTFCGQSNPRGSRNASKVCTQKTLPATWSVLLVYTLRL